MYGYSGDPKFEPMSPWGYFWLSVLYTIPIVGLVFLIIFSISSANINRRSFSRSFFCSYVLLLIILLILFLTGGLAALLSGF